MTRRIAADGSRNMGAPASRSGCQPTASAAEGASSRSGIPSAIQRLSDLRAAPVVGRTYLVPCVEYTYLNRRDIWPVIGQRHSDREYIGFDPLHYHIDPRFLNGAQASHVRRHGRSRSVKETVAVYPLSRYGDAPPEIAKLLPRRCRIKAWAYTPPTTPPWLGKLSEAFGDPAIPIRTGDGRLLCPHQKADLSQMVPDENGIVVCPLHGLRVRCAPKGGAR